MGLSGALGNASEPTTSSCKRQQITVNVTPAPRTLNVFGPKTSFWIPRDPSLLAMWVCLKEESPKWKGLSLQKRASPSSSNNITDSKYLQHAGHGSQQMARGSFLAWVLFQVQEYLKFGGMFWMPVILERRAALKELDSTDIASDNKTFEWAIVSSPKDENNGGEACWSCG